MNLNSLSAPQHEVLRLLHKSDDNAATPLTIGEYSGHGQQQVYDTLVASEKLDYIRQIQREGETVRYQVSCRPRS